MLTLCSLWDTWKTFTFPCIADLKHQKNILNFTLYAFLEQFLRKWTKSYFFSTVTSQSIDNWLLHVASSTVNDHSLITSSTNSSNLTSACKLSNCQTTQFALWEWRSLTSIYLTITKITKSLRKPWLPKQLIKPILPNFLIWRAVLGDIYQCRSRSSFFQRKIYSYNIAHQIRYLDNA